MSRRTVWRLCSRKHSLISKFFWTLIRKFRDFCRKVFTKVNEPGKIVCKCPEGNFEIFLKSYNDKFILIFFGLCVVYFRNFGGKLSAALSKLNSTPRTGIFLENNNQKRYKSMKFSELAKGFGLLAKIFGRLSKPHSTWLDKQFRRKELAQIINLWKVVGLKQKLYALMRI